MPSEKNWPRFIVLKVVGLVLALVFLALSALAIGYPAISTASNFGGVDAKIVDSASQTGQHPWGGVYKLTVSVYGQKYKNVYSLYPQWPDRHQPVKGDSIKVWPEIKPRVAAVEVDGWGWLILGSLFIVGLITLEFTFLAVSLR